MHIGEEKQPRWILLIMFHVKHMIESAHMTSCDLIFQRTQAGRDEIYQKSHGLTQSERLVLIMIDGVGSYQAVRNKLPVLADQRFDRVMKKLQEKELISEVFLPLANQAVDELEPAIIDRFLQQDPLDPVTIILIDPDEYLDASTVEVTPAAAASPTQNDDARADPPRSPAAVDIFAQIDELAVAMEREWAAAVPASPALLSAPIAMAPVSTPLLLPAHHAPLHWGYWLILIGLGFLTGYGAALLAR
jgi:hypothetical protein